MLADDRDKPSWKELDLARDRGIKTTKGVSRQEKRESALAATKAKKDLNALFSGGKLNQEKLARKKAIEALRGSANFSAEISRYIKDFGFPRELEMILVCCDHRDPQELAVFLKEILRSVHKLSLSEQEILVAKLRSVALSTFDPQVVDLIQEIESSL